MANFLTFNFMFDDRTVAFVFSSLNDKLVDFVVINFVFVMVNTKIMTKIYIISGLCTHNIMFVNIYLIKKVKDTCS